MLRCKCQNLHRGGATLQAPAVQTLFPAYKGYRGNKITLKAAAGATAALVDKDAGRTGVHDWSRELKAYADARTAFEKYKVTDNSFTFMEI